MKALIFTCSFAVTGLLAYFAPPPPPVLASHQRDGGGCHAGPNGDPVPCPKDDNCGENQVEIGVPLREEDKCVGSKSENPIIDYLKTAIRFASGAFGLIVILMIIISGIQYIISQGDPNNVKTAKSRLNNAVIGLILFIMTYAVLEYLIPGRIFGS